MKKTEIIALVGVVIILAFIVSTTVDLGSYVSFEDAKEKKGETVILIGKLNKAKPITYNPEENPNLTHFFATDEDGEEFKVYLHEAKPQGLSRSEEITLTGTYKDNAFHASKMQMKCPSKYEKNELDHLDYDKNKVYTEKN